KKEVKRGAIGLANEQDGRDSSADAANGAGTMRSERTRIHDAEVTFAVHDFAGERLWAETNGRDGCIPVPGGHALSVRGGTGRGDALVRRAEGILGSFNHGLTATVDESALQADGLAVKASDGFIVESEFERLHQIVTGEGR